MKKLLIICGLGIAMFSSTQLLAQGVEIKVYNPFIPGNISLDPQSKNTAITGSLATGGAIETTTYNWEISKNNGVTWSVIPGETKKDLKYTKQSKKKLASGMYRRHDMNKCGDGYTNKVKISDPVKKPVKSKTKTKSKKGKN